MAATILLVDDEPQILQALSGLLQDEEFEVLTAPDGETALRLVREAAPDLVMLDIALPGRDGLEILKDIKDHHPALPVIMISAFGSVENAVRATRLGAYDFIEKPPHADKILLSVRNALEMARLADENRLLRQQAIPAREIIGQSAAINEVRDELRLVAPTVASVLITGENGTGKELVARALHYQSRRAHRPFVEVNCAAIPDDLIESELFGHEKGAFTGATSRRQGKFDLAHEGTLFLDEIGDMSLKTQAKILRILEEQRFERVGGSRPIQVDVRVVAATNKNLEKEITKGNFREDLYHRINVIPLARAAPKRPPGGHPAAGQLFPGGTGPGKPGTPQNPHPPGPGGPGQPVLARQCPGIEEPYLAGLGPHSEPGHRRGRPPPGAGPGHLCRRGGGAAQPPRFSGGPGPLRAGVPEAQAGGA